MSTKPPPSDGTIGSSGNRGGNVRKYCGPLRVAGDTPCPQTHYDNHGNVTNKREINGPGGGSIFNGGAHNFSAPTDKCSQQQQTNEGCTMM